MYERGSPVPLEVVAAIRSAFPDTPAPPSMGEVEATGLAISDDLLGRIRYAGLVPCSSSWGDPLAAQDLRPIEPKFAGANRFLCKVVGDSCWPYLKQGDLTVWELDESPPFESIVIAERFEDSGCTVKELLYDGKRPRLEPMNPDAEAPDDGEGWKASAMLVGLLRTEDGIEMTWYLKSGLRKRHLAP